VGIAAGIRKQKMILKTFCQITEIKIENDHAHSG
jgi:hypothetical protein